jgi:hypothetical protein
MTGWTRFDPSAATFDESEEEPPTPAKVAKAAKVSSEEPVSQSPEAAAQSSPPPQTDDQPTTFDRWDADDWQAFFDERAAVAEYEGGLPRAEAEADAFACCVVEWLNRNPARSSPVICCWCGVVEREDKPLLPFGLGSAGQAWLHDTCWMPWRKRRETEALAALAASGVTEPLHSRRPLS